MARMKPEVINMQGGGMVQMEVLSDEQFGERLVTAMTETARDILEAQVDNILLAYKRNFESWLKENENADPNRFRHRVALAFTLSPAEYGAIVTSAKMGTTIKIGATSSVVEVPRQLNLDLASGE